MVPEEQWVFIFSSSAEPWILDGALRRVRILRRCLRSFFSKSGGWTSTSEFIEHEVSHQMTGSKCRQEADDDVRKAMARARKFLVDRGIDCAAPIHREDAARFMVEFAVLETDFSEEMRLARKMMRDRHHAAKTGRLLAALALF